MVYSFLLFVLVLLVIVSTLFFMMRWDSKIRKNERVACDCEFVEIYSVTKLIWLLNLKVISYRKKLFANRSIKLFLSVQFVVHTKKEYLELRLTMEVFWFLLLFILLPMFFIWISLKAIERRGMRTVGGNPPGIFEVAEFCR